MQGLETMPGSIPASLPFAAAFVRHAAALLVGSFLASSAHADLKLCNSTASRVGVSIGYQDQTGWSTEGWWNIASQTCETLLKGAVPSRFIYVHAVDYDRGGEWAGSNYMCTADKSFAIRGVQDCPKRGYKRTGFLKSTPARRRNGPSASRIQIIKRLRGNETQ